MQTRKGSAVEAVLNVFIGYWISVGAYVLIFPMIGIDVPLSTNMSIGLIFMFISLTRAYVLRRVFDHYRLFRERK